MEACKLGNCEPSEVLWGEALSLHYIISALRGSKKSALINKFTAENSMHTVAVLETLIKDEMTNKNNDDGKEAAWPAILLYKIIVVTKLACKWNSIDPKSAGRNSTEIRRWVAENEICKSLENYNDLIPYVPEAPFNALALASRFGERKRYPDLLERLKRSYVCIASFADSKELKKTPSFDIKEELIKELKKDPDFDEDFDDFIAWFSNTRNDADSKTRRYSNAQN